MSKSELEKNHFEQHFANIILSSVAMGQWYSTHFPARVCKIIYIMLPTKSESAIEYSNILVILTKKSKAEGWARENVRINKLRRTLGVSLVPNNSNREGFWQSTGTDRAFAIFFFLLVSHCITHTHTFIQTYTLYIVGAIQSIQFCIMHCSVIFNQLRREMVDKGQCIARRLMALTTISLRKHVTEFSLKVTYV